MTYGSTYLVSGAVDALMRPWKPEVKTMVAVKARQLKPWFPSNVRPCHRSISGWGTGIEGLLSLRALSVKYTNSAVAIIAPILRLR